VAQALKMRFANPVDLRGVKLLWKVLGEGLCTVQSLKIPKTVPGKVALLSIEYAFLTTHATLTTR
jgi:hypothetical protein